MTDLQIAPAGTNVQLSWTGTGAASYRIYGGGPYEARSTVDAVVSGTSATLPVSGIRPFLRLC